MNFGGDHSAPGHGKISPRCVPVLPAVARLCSDAFPGYRPWQDIALMRSRAAGHGKIAPRCVPEGASDEKNTGSRQHIAAMYSDTANFGKICAPCIRKAPQSAVGECTARTSCRQGALSPSEALKSCTAHESCHPPMDLPLRRGSCPSNCIAGSSFNGLALAQGGVPTPPSASLIPATHCTPLLFKLNQTRPVGLGGSFRRKGTEHVKELRYGRGSLGSATSSGLPSRVASCPRLTA